MRKGLDYRNQTSDAICPSGNREVAIGLIKMHLKRRRVNEAVININLNEEFAWLMEFAVGRCS